ncbi:MAG: tetratricopeptide repeat protein [Myxococcales bacterium]|nr:tetratricopeptide repeat protein [Myxococcales bacterium]
MTALLTLALAACASHRRPRSPPPSPRPRATAAPPAPHRPRAPVAAALIADARRAAAAGDLTTAEARYRDALARQPTADVLYDLGVLAEWQGRPDDARARYRDALTRDPTLGPAVIALGRLLIRESDPQGALRLARDQLARAPDAPALRNALGRLRLDAGLELDQVEADAKAVLRDDEKNVDAMINLAAAYHHDGRHELAIAILDNARALRPDDPEILARKALAHRALGEDQRARFALEEATALPGGATAEVHNNLGLIYHAAGDYPGAEAQFRRALARWPGMLAATINLANALKGQQRFAEADAALQQALARAPRDPDVLYNLGILYLDGQLPDLAPADRLGRALAFFERYQQTATPRAADDPAAEYIEEARKRIEVERKRAEQQRTAPKAPPPPDPPPAAPAAAGSPPATPPTRADEDEK